MVENLVLLCEPCHIYIAHNGNSAKDINIEAQNQFIENSKNKLLSQELNLRYNVEKENIDRLIKKYINDASQK